jgi:lipoprotein-anchoring transpeptidase ErfK/SrfK
LQSPDGPQYNPYWYRIDGGYIHRGHVQRIEFRPPNEPLISIPEGGLWGEVTVPYTRTFWRNRETGWVPLYRLYFESVHWIKGVCENPDGMVWYSLFDPKNDSTYYVPAADVRPIATTEYTPIARDVPAGEKRIVVSIAEQTLTAYEGDEEVLRTLISSGVPSLEPPPEGEPPTDTPKGSWRIQLKTPSRHMGNGRLTSDYEAYELPGVPWTMAFHQDGYALHGSYWHNNFGRQMSHGCINMRNVDALWLFRWSDPVFDTRDWYTRGLGTLLIIV